jgi:hypothetical protein
MSSRSRWRLAGEALPVLQCLQQSAKGCRKPFGGQQSERIHHRWVSISGGEEVKAQRYFAELQQDEPVGAPQLLQHRQQEAAEGLGLSAGKLGAIQAHEELIAAGVSILPYALRGKAVLPFPTPGFDVPLRRL